MKSVLTVSGVVFAHICAFLLLANGCQGSNKAEAPNWTSNTSVYSGGARSSAVPQETPAPAKAQPAKAAPAKPAPAQATSAQPAPAKAESAEKKDAPANATEKTDSNEKTYVVKKGDMLSTIAVRNGLTAKELASANGIELNSILREGQTLKIPAAKPKKTDSKKAQVEGEIYVVKKGDILGKIAQEHKTTVAKIKEANNLKNDVIRAGQKLVIPSKDSKKAETTTSSAEKNQEPAQAKSAEKPEPAKAAPAEKKSDAATKDSTDENFGMPVGGFGGFNDVPVSDGNAPAQAEPAQAEPAQAAPAQAVPAK